MITVETDVRRADGVGLVTAVLANGSDRERTVRLRATVPPMPPRRRGVPERGWDGRDLTVRVPPGATRGVGFATADDSVDADDPPVELVDHAAADPPAGPDPEDPTSLVRSLGTSRPPADAVPLADRDPDRERDGDDEADEDGDADTPSDDWEWVGETRRVRRRESDCSVAADDADPADGAGTGGDDSNHRDDRDDADDGDDPALPGPVADWFDRVDGRCGRVERVSADASLTTATEALAAAGGLDALTADARRLDDDARRLRALAARAERLAARAEAAELPREPLEAVA